MSRQELEAKREKLEKEMAELESLLSREVQSLVEPYPTLGIFDTRVTRFDKRPKTPGSMSLRKRLESWLNHVKGVYPDRDHVDIDYLETLIRKRNKEVTFEYVLNSRRFSFLSFVRKNINFKALLDSLEGLVTQEKDYLHEVYYRNAKLLVGREKDKATFYLRWKLDPQLKDKYPHHYAHALNCILNIFKRKLLIWSNSPRYAFKYAGQSFDVTKTRLYRRAKSAGVLDDLKQHAKKVNSDIFNSSTKASVFEPSSVFARM